MNKPLVCDYCHALNPGAVMKDYFALLGLLRQYEIDQELLHSKFVALSRHVHPDFHNHESPEVQKLSLELSSTINDAYRTLKDPAGRADYLLELLGGKSSAEDKSVPDGFLGTMMMMQEELADAKASADSGELARLSAVLKTQREGLLRRIGGLFEEYRQGLACNAIRREVLDEIRKHVNAVSYVRRLLSQLD